MMCPTSTASNSDNGKSYTTDALSLYEKLTLKSETNEKIRTALRVLEGAVRLYTPHNFAVAFNGGKDATVVMHLARAVVAHHAASTDASMPSLNCLYLLGDPTTRDEFPQVESFVHEQVSLCKLQAMEVDADFKKGILAFTSQRTAHCAFVMGTRHDDPHGKTMQHFEPSSLGWPPFMRVNPILTWEYHDVWRFLKEFNLPYCCLYNEGYTSIGSVTTTRPNPALRVVCEDSGKISYKPAWELEDGSLERAGRLPRPSKISPQEQQETNGKLAT